MPAHHIFQGLLAQYKSEVWPCEITYPESLGVKRFRSYSTLAESVSS